MRLDGRHVEGRRAGVEGHAGGCTTMPTVTTPPAATGSAGARVDCRAPGQRAVARAAAGRRVGQRGESPRRIHEPRARPVIATGRVQIVGGSLERRSDAGDVEIRSYRTDGARTAAATWGAAMDVPLAPMYSPLVNACGDHVDTIDVPAPRCQHTPGLLHHDE